MDDEQQESLKQWVAQVTSAMQSIETFGHTAIGTVEQVTVVLRDHEKRIEEMETALSGLVDEGKELMDAIREYVQRQ